MAGNGGSRKDAGAILAQPAKPGVVGLQGVDNMDDRIRMIAEAESGPDGSTNLEKQELERLAKLTPAQLLTMGSARDSFASDGSAYRYGPLPSPSSTFVADRPNIPSPELGVRRGADGGDGLPAAGAAGDARRPFAPKRTSSEMDMTDAAESHAGRGKAAESSASRDARNRKFEVRVALEDKPGLVLMSAGATKSLETDSDGHDEPSPESMSEMRPLGTRPGHARASVGLTGAEAMARALESMGAQGDTISPEAAAKAQHAYRQAVRAASKRRFGSAAVAPGGSDDEDQAEDPPAGSNDTASAAFYGGTLKDSKGGPAAATSRMGGGDRPRVGTGMKSTRLRSRLQQAGKTVAHAAQVSKRVPDVDPKCLLSKDSPMMRTWDVLMIILLLYTALLTPFEVSFVDSKLFDAWFWVNRVVDCGFLVDLVFNFFLPFYDPATRRDVKNHTSIAVNYLTGWFGIDILSIFPFDIVFESVGGVGVSDAASTFRIVRVIRLLKLAKLLRVVRASRIVKRWRTRVGLSFSLVQLLSFLIYVLLLAHWSACGFYLVGTLTKDVPNGITSWTVEERIEGRPWDAYIASLYFSTMTTTTIGYGDIVPYNSGERLFTVFLMILGGALYAYVIGAIGTIVANFDGATSEHRANMDQLNRYTNELDLPQRLREELREYFAQTLSIQRERYYSHLLTFMSPKLRGHVAMHRHGEWIRHVPFFNVGNVHERIAFVTAVAMELQPAVFGKLERVMYAGQTINRMYIIQTGLATVQGRIVQRGHFFGEEAILTQARAISTVRALTYLDVFYLTKDSLNRILDSGDFSETRKKIRYAVIRMALRRELLKCAALARIQNGLFRIAQGGTLAYAPDPTADLELDHADAADEESLMQAATSAPASRDGRKNKSVVGGRPPSPPPQGLLALATQVSRQRAVRESDASRSQSERDALAGLEAAASAVSSDRPPASRAGSARSAAASSRVGDLTAGPSGHSAAADTDRSPHHQPPFPGGALQTSAVVSGSRPQPRVVAAGFSARRSEPTFGAASSASDTSGSVGFGGADEDSKRIQAGAESAATSPQATARSAGAAGAGLTQPSGMDETGTGRQPLTGEQRAALARDARRMESRMPALARHMSRQRLMNEQGGPQSGPPGRRMSRPFSRPGQALTLSAQESVGPFGLSTPASSPQADHFGVGLPATPLHGEPDGVGFSTDLMASEAAPPSETDSASRRPSYERGIMQRVLAKAVKLEADGDTVNHIVSEVLGQVKTMEAQLDKAASGIRMAQYIAACACLICAVLLGVLLSRE